MTNPGDVGVIDIKSRATDPEVKQYDKTQPYSHPEDLYCFYPFQVGTWQGSTQVCAQGGFVDPCTYWRKGVQKVMLPWWTPEYALFGDSDTCGIVLRNKKALRPLRIKVLPIL